MDTMKICQQCRQPLPENSPEGLCPACLAKVALGSEPSAPKPRTAPAASQLAELFPQLEIIEFLGMGGMGMVYKARQPRLDRFVALKILPMESASDPSFAERFSREAKALAKLNHPGIVSVYDFGQCGQYYYFLMEYVDGMNLRQLQAQNPVTPRQALELVVQICTALQYAHDEGVVHRDIKPENILLNKKGQVKIADFGLAKLLGNAPDPALTLSQTAMGTINYMAPEQRQNAQSVDHRADIYSLGVVFYEMLTGEVPMGRFEPPSKKVQVDVRLDEVVLRALEREPARRYQQASEVKQKVENITSTTPTAETKAAGEKPASQMPAAAGKPDLFWRRLVVIVLAVAGVCLLVSLLGIIASIAVPSFVRVRQQAQQGGAQQLTQDGWRLWQGGNLAEARNRFSEAVQLDPGKVEAWSGLGWAWFNAGEPATAKTNFEKAISLDANHPGALNGLGQICLAEGNYGEAEKYLLRAAPKAPAAWFGLARLYLLEGKFDQAAEWAQKIADSGQGNETVRQVLKAAQEKHLSEGLRLVLEPPTHGNGGAATNKNQ
jgi:tetratricopeptide (TPR) repeat protein